ncbi:MAG: hypothetical protein ACXWOX_11015 [Ktedonobacteraceae bacterium]
MTEQRQGLTKKQPARNLPGLTQEQIRAAARQQALREADHGYSGHSAGIHPEQQSDFIDDELEEDEAYYETRPPSSARRYQGYAVSPEEVYQSGKTRLHVKYVGIPQRSNQQQHLPPAGERYRAAVEARPQRTPQRGHVHPAFWFGVFCMLLISGWIGLTFVASWYQGMQNDWTYGTQRHLEVNAVVGHNDSPDHPSHFTAENNDGQIIVMELPGGDVAKAKIYLIETVPGNTGNPPVKLSFQDMNGDGKVDMIVMIGDGNAMVYVTLFNNGNQFVPKL